MCGIAGEICWNGSPNLEAVRNMTGRLRHRGPDAEGFQALGPLALGHRRLTVIDVSESSNQPLADHTGRFWIVFNGEIYNYRELRAELESHDSRFVTRGDTEVILEAYKRWGHRALDRLNGMFAFALWDGPEQRLLLARDRLGKKPLYFRRSAENGLIFASELQALRAHPEVSDELSPRAVGEFLSLNYTLTDSCILRDVSKLPPAHFLVVRRGSPPSLHRYWDLAAFFRRKRPAEDRQRSREELGALLDDAVRLRLVSDVPLGAFLSGGIDSSIIVESMSRLQPPERVQTFSMGFEEDTYSELDKARSVAAFLGVDHHDRAVSAAMASALPEIVRRIDEPFADTSMIPVFFLAKFAREQVTVCLSGDGADEIFAGYPTYTADRLHEWLSWIPRPLLGTARFLVDRFWPVSFSKVSFDYKLRRFLEGLSVAPHQAHHHWRVIFRPEDKHRLLRPELREICSSDGFETFATVLREVAACDPLDQAMYVDLKTWLVDDILVKVDRATMAHSLECRNPFLDYRLVEFSASLPSEWRMKGLRKKYLLRQARAGSLPARVMRQRKQGFNAPVSHWLVGDLEAMARSVLTESPLGQWVDPRAIDRMWAEHHAGQRDHGLGLFGLTCLGLWMSQGE